MKMFEVISLHSFCTIENKSLNLYILSGHNINKVHFIKLSQLVQQRKCCHFLFVLTGRLHVGNWPGGELGEGSHPPWWLLSAAIHCAGYWGWSDTLTGVISALKEVTDKRKESHFLGWQTWSEEVYSAKAQSSESEDGKLKELKQRKCGWNVKGERNMERHEFRGSSLGLPWKASKAMIGTC